MSSNACLFSSFHITNLRESKIIRDKIRNMFIKKFGTTNPVVGYIDSGYDAGMGQLHSVERFFKMWFGIDSVEFLDPTLRYTEDDHDNILACDVIVLGGGNTFESPAWLKYRGILEDLKNIKDDIIFMGTSAGSIICTDSIKIANFADSNYLKLTDFSSLGLTDVSFKPHFDSGGWDLQMDKFIAYSKRNKKIVYGVNEGDCIIIDNDVVMEYGCRMTKIVNGVVIK